MWSRMTVATLLNRMTPSEVINSIMKNWVTYGGVPGDNILERLDEDFQEVQLSTKLACAGMAKNSLQMVYGYSPNQLVFGQNPLLPNISADGPPAWEEKTASEMIFKHLNILHAARKAFINSESSSCLKLHSSLRSEQMVRS